MMDLDDLFDDQLGDSLNELSNDHLNGQLNGHLPGPLDVPAPVPPPPGLAERVDELRLSGCVDKISWARTGSIAHITKDNRSVSITNLRFRSDDGTWVRNNYADPMLSEAISKIYKGRRLVHVVWNPNSASDLVVSDIHGRMTIFTVGYPCVINRLQGNSVLNIDPEDSLNTLVGLNWLNIKRPNPICRHAQKIDGNWKYATQSVDPRGPYAPNKWSCFVAVTRGGLVRLCYQVPGPQGHITFQEMKKDLDGFSTTRDLLTHATLCSDRDDLILLAVHTQGKQLRLYSMKIDFHAKPGEQAPMNPTIDFQHLSTIDTCCPSSETPIDPLLPTPELSHLTFLPRGLEQRDPSYPCVLATFTSMPRNLTDSNDQNTAYSIFSRWEFREETPVLDTSFAKLGSKKSGVSELKAQQSLVRLEDVKVDRLLISIHILYFGAFIACGSPDGSVEVRNRNMTMLALDESSDKVSSLFHLGFSFNNREPSLNIALSPNYAVRASFAKDHEIKTSPMEIDVNFIDSGGPATSDKIAAAFVMANTTATVAEANSFNNNVNDDLVMTMQILLNMANQEQRETIKGIFLKDFYTIFGFQDKLFEGMPSIDKTIRLPLTAKCLSLQAALGDRGEVLSRTLSSKVAYTTLSARNFALSFMMAFAKTSGPEVELNKPDVFQYLVALIAWFGILEDYICDQLLDLNRSLDLKNFNFQALKDRITHLNTPILHLMLSTFTRSLLRHCCRAVRSIIAQSPQAQPGSPLHPHYASLLATFRTITISPPVFENLLTQCDGIVGKAFEGLTDVQKQQAEFSVLLLGDIPDALQGAVREILETAVEKIRQQNHNPMQMESDLAFKDWKVLGLLDDEKSKRWRREAKYDLMRRTDISKEARVRRCTRCNALMEDLNSQRIHKGGGVFIQIFRTCFCGGHWLVDPPPSRQ